jgi:hypothetical protein
MAATVRATKKAPAKKIPPAPQADVPAARSAAPFEPLRLSSTPDSPPEMVDLFEIDGIMYQVPREPSASIGLQYLDAVETLGAQAANLFILREMLGPDGYMALSTCKTLKEPQLAWVVQTIHDLAMGTVEAPKA